MCLLILAGEANLDVRYLLGVSHPVPIVECRLHSSAIVTLRAISRWHAAFQNRTARVAADLWFRRQTSLRRRAATGRTSEFLTELLAKKDSELPQTLATSCGEEEQSVPQELRAQGLQYVHARLGARGVSVLFSSGRLWARQ